MTNDRIAGAAREGLGRVQDGYGGLAGDEATQARGKVNEVAGRVQNAYGKVKDKAEDVYAETRERAEAVYSETRGKAEAVYNETRDKAGAVYTDVEEYLHGRPLMALTLGVGIGLLAGLLMRGDKVVYLRKV